MSSPTHRYSPFSLMFGYQLEKVTILKYTNVSNQHIVHFELTHITCHNYLNNK